jgi:hypothetical protein
MLRTTDQRGFKMEHLRHSDPEGESPPPPIEWLKVGTTVADLTNQLSARNDIIALVGPDAAHGAPACFFPHHSEVELNTNTAFGPRTAPEDVGDLTDPKRQYEFPRAVGLIAHEAFHARYSRWSASETADQLNAEEFKAFELLEESRIEYQGLQDVPRVREFIRSAVIDINLEHRPEMEHTEAAFQVFGLINARVQAGTLEEREVEDVVGQVTDFLGAELSLHLSGIVSTFHESRDLSERHQLAREWVAAKHEAADQRGEKPDGGFDPAALAQAVKNALEDIILTASIALADQESDEVAEAFVLDVQQKTKQRKRNEQEAEKLFSKASELSSSFTRSYMKQMRDPTPEERAAAVIVATELEKAKYHDRIEIETDNYLPPGRLRTRALVQARAAESKGLRLASTPWRRTKRKHTIDPSLTVGVMVDISGSMSSAMEPMAVTAWVMSEAVRRIQGRAAMIYYGDSVFPTLSPGQHLEKVYIYGAYDGSEEFDKAFRGLDGALGLLEGSGARLLVISSDGHYRSDQIEQARHWITECAKAGVAILWLPYDTGRSLSRLLGPGVPQHHISVVTGTMSPAGVATRIGRAAAAALAQASQ